MPCAKPGAGLHDPLLRICLRAESMELRVFYGSILCTFMSWACEGWEVAADARSQPWKKLSGNRDLKISALGDNNSSRIYGGRNIGFVHSYQIGMEALKLESLPDTSPSDIFSSKQEKYLFSSNHFIKTTLHMQQLQEDSCRCWFLAGSFQISQQKCTSRNQEEERQEKSDTNQCSPLWNATTKGSTKTV